MGGEWQKEECETKKKPSEVEIIPRLKLLHLDIARDLQIKQINSS